MGKGTRNYESGFYLTRSTIAILVSTVVVLLVVEGLLIGLVARPDCSDVSVVTEAHTTTTKATTEKTTEGPTKPAGPWTNIRLPGSLIPIEYDISLRPILEPDASGKYIFHGSSSVSYTCKNATEYVILHSAKLEYTKDQLKIKVEDADFPIKSIMFYEENEFVVIETDHPCEEGVIYQLSVDDFQGELTTDLTGLYISEYDAPDGEHQVMATSHMHPNGARETFPCFDEPAMKANFTITVWYRADGDRFALSNMPPMSHEVKAIDGAMWNSTKFQKSVPMSTYLLAIMVANFEHEERYSSEHNIQTRVYARTAAVNNGEASYAAEITPKILEFFEEYLNVSYALPKLDQAAVPDFGAGAMENWGLVTYRETFLLYNDEVSSVFDKQRCTNVIAHELAHQWFGNLVSHAWWDDVWLSEGFATYFSYIGEAAVQPTWKSNDMFLITERFVPMEIDALTSSHPLVQPADTLNEISAQYDDINYNKGACILRMFNDYMGEEYFIAGLTAYLNDFKFGVATHDDLSQSLQDQTVPYFPAPLSTILDTWTLQMGYPVINIERAPGTGTYFASQQYFLWDTNATLVQTPGSLTYGYKWYVALTYKTFSQLYVEHRQWLTPSDDSISLMTSEDIFVNIDGAGYYRVNYDVGTWRQLSEKLKSATFTDMPTSNRAILIDDAFNLARPGLLDISIPMELSMYLVNETEYVPWRTFMDRVKSVEYIIGRSMIYGAFSNYIVQLVEPSLYSQYGWEEVDKSDSALVERMTMQLAIQGSCYYGSEDCISNAVRLYGEWMTDPDNSSIISNTYRDDVYCSAIRNGGIEEWNFGWERHNAISNAQEKASIRFGLACSKEPWILSRYMEYCLDTSVVRMQDSLRTCLQYIGGEEYGRDLAWAFMLENWDMLVEMYGGGISFDSLIEVITRRFSTEYDLQRLKDFASSTSNLGSASRAVDQAIERTKLNIKWRELNEDSLAWWLEDSIWPA